MFHCVFKDSRYLGVEIRARDDNDNGGHTYWESMYQWSTTNYEIENTGEGMGTVTLSTTEITIPSGISGISTGVNDLEVNPNPVIDIANLRLSLTQSGRVCVELNNIDGRKLVTLPDEFKREGEQLIPPDIRNFSKGSYSLRINSDSGLESFSSKPDRVWNSMTQEFHNDSIRPVSVFCVEKKACQ